MYWITRPGAHSTDRRRTKESREHTPLTPVRDDEDLWRDSGFILS
jgi:hypothetical protein